MLHIQIAKDFEITREYGNWAAFQFQMFKTTVIGQLGKLGMGSIQLDSWQKLPDFPDGRIRDIQHFSYPHPFGKFADGTMSQVEFIYAPVFREFLNQGICCVQRSATAIIRYDPNLSYTNIKISFYNQSFLKKGKTTIA